ncbi:hypothetical protein KAW38_01210 [Candidatus Micrarchaeota archaeon]|nr:hypothetical protein [Candidatus Micrarchaeota archaeon]
MTSKLGNKELRNKVRERKKHMSLAELAERGTIKLKPHTAKEIELLNIVRSTRNTPLFELMANMDSSDMKQIVKTNKNTAVFEKKIKWINAITMELVNREWFSSITNLFAGKTTEEKLVGNPASVKKLLVSDIKNIKNVYYALDFFKDDGSLYSVFVDNVIKYTKLSPDWKPLLDKIKNMEPAEQFSVLLGTHDNSGFVKKFVENNTKQ